MKGAVIKRMVLDASVAVAWCFEDESSDFTEGAAYERKGRDYPIGYARWTENRNMEAFPPPRAYLWLRDLPLGEHVGPREQRSFLDDWRLVLCCATPSSDCCTHTQIAVGATSEPGH